MKSTSQLTNEELDSWNWLLENADDEALSLILPEMERLAGLDPTDTATDTLEPSDEYETARAGNPVPLLWTQWPCLRVNEKSPNAKHFPQGVGLDQWQIWDVVAPMWADSHCEVNIKGCTSAGKGAAVAIGICGYYTLYDDAKVVLTSATYQHARDVIWGEVRKWWREMAWPPIQNLLRESVSKNEDSYMKIANPETEEGFSGHHSEHVLFVVDEATALASARYDLIKTQAHKIVALANPRTMGGWFRRNFGKVNPDETRDVETPMGKRRLVTIGGEDCLNVKAGKPLIPGQLDRSRFKELCSKSPRWAGTFAHGLFPPEDPELQVILGSWLDRHQRAWRRDLPVTAFGLDLAGSVDGDKTVLACGSDVGVNCLKVWQERDTMSAIGSIIAWIKGKWHIDLTQGRHPVVVDMDGLGKGAGDRLRELGVDVREWRGNASSRVDPKIYGNLRAQGYGELGKRLDPEGPWPDDCLALPDDEELIEELVAPEKIFKSDGFCYHITPKDRSGNKNFQGDTLREKLGRSPDKADAVVMLHHAIALPIGVPREFRVNSFVGPGLYG